MNAFLRITKVICFLVLMCLPCVTSAQGEIASNWWDNNMLIAKGYGFPPSNVTTLQSARMFSRRAAIIDGYRNLAEQTRAIHITAETTIESLLLTDDVINTKVNAVIRGAKILSEEYAQDGSCTVTLAVPVFGVMDSLAGIIFKPFDKKEFPLPSVEHKSTGNYTGLIIDCGDADLKPVLMPVIRNADNQSIYSYSNLDYDKVIAHGMVGYVKNDKEENMTLPLTKTFKPLTYTKLIENKLLFVTNVSAVSRAGDNPLIIKAESMSDDNSCPVVSVSDADKILAENQATHFLDNGAVVFTGYRVGGVRA